LFTGYDKTTGKCDTNTELAPLDGLSEVVDDNDDFTINNVK
jgi:hypothetical protein